MLMLRPIIAKLHALGATSATSVMVVKHDHVPKESRKFLGQPQRPYQKKNWSSVHACFNNARCRALTPSSM